MASGPPTSPGVGKTCVVGQDHTLCSTEWLSHGVTFATGQQFVGLGDTVDPPSTGLASSDPDAREIVYVVPGTLLPVKVPCSVVNSTAIRKTAETS